MLSKEVHSEYIKQVNKVVDDGGKKASADVLKRIGLKLILSNPQKARKLFIATMLQHSKEVFGQVQKIGTELKTVKESQ